MSESIITKTIMSLIGHLDRKTVERLFHTVMDYLYGDDPHVYE